MHPCPFGLTYGYVSLFGQTFGSGIVCARTSAPTVAWLIGRLDTQKQQSDREPYREVADDFTPLKQSSGTGR